MVLTGLLTNETETAVERHRLYGAYPALVTNIKDPDNQGRVKVRLPWSPDDAGYEVWAEAIRPTIAEMLGQLKTSGR